MKGDQFCDGCAINGQFAARNSDRSMHVSPAETAKIPSKTGWTYSESLPCPVGAARKTGE